MNDQPYQAAILPGWRAIPTRRQSATAALGFLLGLVVAVLWLLGPDLAEEMGALADELERRSMAGR